MDQNHVQKLIILMLFLHSEPVMQTPLSLLQCSHKTAQLHELNREKLSSYTKTLFFPSSCLLSMIQCLIPSCHKKGASEVGHLPLRAVTSYNTPWLLTIQPDFPLYIQANFQAYASLIWALSLRVASGPKDSHHSPCQPPMILSPNVTVAHKKQEAKKNQGRRMYMGFEFEPQWTSHFQLMINLKWV